MSINLQDIFLNQLRINKIPATIILAKGVRMNGIVRGYDAYSIIIETEGKQQMILKSALSTIIPSKNIEVMMNES